VTWRVACQRGRAWPGHLAGKEGHLVGKEGHLAGKEGHLAGKEEHLAGKEGHLAGKEGHLAGKEGHLAGKEERLAGKEERLAGKEGHLAGKEGHLAGKEEHLAGKEGHLAGKEGHLAGKEGHLAGKEGHLAGKEGHLAGKEEHLAGKEGRLAGKDGHLPSSPAHRDRCLAYASGMAPPILEHVQANGLRFAYFEEGQGPLVLLLHGFPDTPQTWDVVRPALAAAGYRAVTPFTRGYAPTEVPAEEAYDADTLGRDAVALIAALGEEKAFLVGHDWGASAAYSAAGLAPERLRMLVTVAIPHPASILPTPGALWAARHFFTLSRPGAAARIRAGNYEHIDELVQRWSPAWKVPPGETDAVKEAFRVPGCLEAALGYYRALRPRPPVGQRGKLRVPAAAFAGTSDILPPSAYERARSRYSDRYEVVTMPGGHFMHREHPEIFVRELLRVLGQGRAGAGAP